MFLYYLLVLQIRYENAMKVAERNNIRTLAFALISAGIFRGPRSLQSVLDTAVAAVAKNEYPGLLEVHLVAFSSVEERCLHEAVLRHKKNNKFSLEKRCTEDNNVGSTIKSGTSNKSSDHGKGDTDGCSEQQSNMCSKRKTTRNVECATKKGKTQPTMQSIHKVTDTSTIESIPSSNESVHNSSGALTDSETDVVYDLDDNNTSENLPKAEAKNVSNQQANNISDYEQKRLQRMRDNNAMLVALGLADAQSIESNKGTQTQTKRSSRASSEHRKAIRLAFAAKIQRIINTPRRRSLRIRKLAADTDGDLHKHGDTKAMLKQKFEPEPELEPDFEDSSVYRYLCGDRSLSKCSDPVMSHVGSAKGSGDSCVASPFMMSQTFDCNSNKGSLSKFFFNGHHKNIKSGAKKTIVLKGFGLDTSAPTLFDPNLKKIYNIDVGGQQNRLLAAAGHQGRVSIFSLDNIRRQYTTKPKIMTTGKQSESGSNVENAEVAPLLSWKASRGWISGCQFVDQNQYGGCKAQHLITSSNSGDVTLWDLFKEAKVYHNSNNRGQGIQNTIVQSVASQDVHRGSGIFHLHLRGCQFATASKDTTVSYCELANDRMKVIHQFNDSHDSVVKCARLNELSVSPLIASVGNDRGIVVLDVRLKDEAVRVDDVSPYALNSILWRPGHEKQLLVSGFEANAIRLFDLRKPQTCFSLLRGM